MRFGIPLIALLVAGCASSAAQTAPPRAAPARVACGPAGAQTLAASAQARVYASGGGVYGCARGRTVRLGQVRTCLREPRVYPVRVAGPLAAYGLQSCGVDTGTGTVVVRRLTDGRTLSSLPAVMAPLGPESYSAVDSLALRADGAVAWIGLGTSIVSHLHHAEVIAAGAGGRVRQLDSGTGIVPGSLGLHGSRLSWRDGSQTRTASLR